MTYIEEADQDLFEGAMDAILVLNRCNRELIKYNNKGDPSLTPEQRFDDIKRIGKMVNDAIFDADRILNLISVRKVNALQEQSGFLYAMVLAIHTLTDELIWNMYGDLAEKFTMHDADPITTDNKTTKKEN